MIESPVSSAIIAERENTDSKEPLLAKDADVYLVKTAPITAKLRTAIRHLRTVAGPFARIRGFHIAFIYHFLYSIAMGVLGRMTGPFLRPLVSILVTIGLCRLHMTWTHAVISMPSTKSWWQRIPSVKAAKNLIIPTAIWATAQQVCLYVPGALFISVFDTFKRPEVYGGQPQTVQKVALIQLFAVFMIFIATIVLIVVPAEVSLKRVEASMLPEEEETIVPFDKSFAGKFTSEAQGGSGAVTVLDAWRTFGKEARLRLLKLYGKVFAIQIAVAILFTMIMVAELKMITGGDFERFVQAARNSLKGEL